MTRNNLNLSLCFDKSKKFLICGELVKFNLKISSPEFETAPEEFLERIGASIESIEITEGSGLLEAERLAVSSSSSLESIKGKKMKSVESLSNLLRTVDQRSSESQHDHSKDSQHSMSSVTARRFNSLSVNRSIQKKPFWDSEEVAIFIPLEAFIDPECLSSSCQKAIVKFKVSLNELVAIDELEVLRLGFNEFKWTDSVSSAAQSSHKLERIGLVELCMTVLRPLEVSLRTHNLSSNQVILQILVEFNHENEAEDLNGNLKIESVEIGLSDSFTSRKSSNFFKITPISEKQVPFVFETSPQQYSLLFNWTLLKQQEEQFLENYHLRVELFGKLLDKTRENIARDNAAREISDNTTDNTTDRTGTATSELSLSFETSVSIFNLFPVSPSSGIKITSTKLIGTLKVFEPFQIELILHNFDDETKSLLLNIIQEFNEKDKDKYKDNFIKSPSPVDEWFQSRVSKTPGVVIMSPLTTLKVENIPSGGSKAIRLKLLPMKRGIFNLKEEIKIINKSNGKIMKFDKIIIKVE